MRIAKRVFLFVSINILIVATISLLLSALGVQPYLDAKGLNIPTLIVFCLAWGFGGAFISLALSRKMAKWMMGVRLVDPGSPVKTERELVARVYSFAQKAGLKKMPEVGIYESPEINAFATGPSRQRSLVAVSSGLLESMNRDEIDGVLAHEVAHIANGDMVTMTLIQGVVNALVMFLARIMAFFVSQLVDEEKRPLVNIGVILAAEVFLGFFGMMGVAYFSRRREFRADSGGAHLAGTGPMIAALERLKLNSEIPTPDQPALASLKISGKRGGFLRLFSTHPDLDARIAKLKEPHATRTTQMGGAVPIATRM